MPARKASGWLCLALLLTACGSKGSAQADTPSDDRCTDRPGALPRPPTRGLPCELLPPTRTR